MRSLNKVQLIGRLGKEPEIQRFENGGIKVKFPLATSEKYKDRNGNLVEQTEWHNVVAWRRLAEIAESFLRKGSAVYVEGKITTRSWDDQNGNKRYMTEIVADNFIMLDKKQDTIQSNVETGSYEQPEAVVSEPQESDDLPF